MQPTHDLNIPLGAPCWMDLITSEVDRSVEFYQELFGWKAQDTPPEFGGYKYFELNGKAVGGCMQNMPEWDAPNTWSIFLRTDDVRATAAAAESAGGTIMMAPMDVGENGSFVILRDPSGAVISAWQPGAESGFGVMNEDNSPVHFELHTNDYQKAVDFYRDAFGWQPHVLADEERFRYTTFGDAETPRAGIMDAQQFLPQGVPSHWSVYLGSNDVSATVQMVQKLGGSVIAAPEHTPYGTLATVADPAGAVFKLRSE